MHRDAFVYNVTADELKFTKQTLSDVTLSREIRHN